MAFWSHGQYGARSGAHHRLSNAANEDMGQSSSSMRRDYDQINVALAGILDDLRFWRSLHHGWNHRSTGRPLRVESSAHGLLRSGLGLIDVFWQVQPETK